MPYELRFTKALSINDPDIYFNDCCVGGDLVADHLLPLIRERYRDIQLDQEDWGWFIWFKDGATRLSIDIYCDDPVRGAFRLCLTANRKRFLFGYRIADTDEGLKLKVGLLDALHGWADGDIDEARLDSRFNPVDSQSI